MKWFYLQTSWSFPGGSDSKESSYNAGYQGSIPGLGRSPGEGNGYLFQYSCLENLMDRGAWWAAVHGAAKSRTRLSNWHFPDILPTCPTDQNKQTKKEHFNLVIKHSRIDAFKLWCWRRLLRVPWTARSNQSILKKINSEYSLEGLMLELKLQYFGHLIGRTDWLEKTLILGKIEGRRRGWQRIRLNGHEFEQAPGDGEGQRSLARCSPWGHKELDVTEQLNNNNN